MPSDTLSERYLSSIGEKRFPNRRLPLSGHLPFYSTPSDFSCLVMHFKICSHKSLERA